MDLVARWGCAIGSGSQDLLYKAFQVFTDPGDSVLIETYVLPHVNPSAFKSCTLTRGTDPRTRMDHLFI